MLCVRQTILSQNLASDIELRLESGMLRGLSQILAYRMLF